MWWCNVALNSCKPLQCYWVSSEDPLALIPSPYLMKHSFTLDPDSVSKNFGVSWGSNVLFQPGTTFVMTSVGNTPIVGATLSFLRNDDGRYAHEKPYALRYNPQDGIPTENIVKKTVTDIPLHDIRKLPKPPCFDGNGIEVRLLQTQLSYSDFFSDEKIKTTFFSELREDLARLLGTSNIQIFEYKVCIAHLSLRRSERQLATRIGPSTQPNIPSVRWKQPRMGSTSERCTHWYCLLRISGSVGRPG